MSFRFRKLALGAAALVITAGMFAPNASAQDSALQQMMKDGIDLMERGRTEEANAKFREVLAADPSDEDAYNLVRSTDHQVFLDMLTSGGTAEQVAARLLDLSHQRETAKSQDAEAIRGLAHTAVNDRDLGNRVKAANTLAASHGEYAVPALIGYLESTDIDVRANAIMAINKIGADAVAPLAAALSGGSEMRTTNIAGILSRIGDERAVPALLAAGQTGAAEALGGSGDAVEAYLMMAHSYFMGDPMTLRNWDGTFTVWSNDGGQPTGRDVPGFLYNYELAEQACYDALALDASSSHARSGIALVAFAELAAWNDLDDAARTSMAATGDALNGARALASSVGGDDLRGALSMAMSSGHGGAGDLIAGAIARLGDAGSLDGDNALVKALSDSNKSIRYGAAIALAHLDPAEAFDGSNLVGHILGEAAGEVAVRQVLVIDSNDKNAMNTQRALNDAGYHAVAAGSGASGLLMAKTTGGFDAVVVADSLSDITTFQVLDELGADFRTSSAKTVVMSGDSTASATYSSRGISGVADPADSAGVVGAVGSALGDATDAEASRANDVSKRASAALAGVRGNAFNLGDAEAGLMGALREGAPDDVRLAALGALQNVASADSAGALAAIAARTENSAAVRAAAASACGSAIRGQAPSDDVFNALMGAMGGSDAADVDVRSAAGEALGGSALSDEQRTAVMQANRVN